VIAAATPAVWGWSLLAVLAVSLLSLVGALTFFVRRERLDRVLPYLVSVAVGAMLGSAFFHILPDVAGDGFTRRHAALFLLGIVIFFTLERFIHWHQHGHAEGHAAVAPYAWLNLTGDGLHNFADGVIIAAAFMQGRDVGVATTLAVALHEVPQELGDVGVLLQGKLTLGRALALNLATALLAVIGAVVALILGGRLEGFHGTVLAVTGGGFIYIAAADLIPELHRERRPVASIVQMACLLGGIGLMYVLH
jgi:zinc and cadmium transporter